MDDSSAAGSEPGLLSRDDWVKSTYVSAGHTYHVARKRGYTAVAADAATLGQMMRDRDRGRNP